MIIELNQSVKEGIVFAKVMTLFKEHLNENVSFKKFDRHPRKEYIVTVTYSNITNFTSSHLSKIIRICKEEEITFVDFHHFGDDDLNITFYFTNEYSEFDNNTLFWDML